MRRRPSIAPAPTRHWRVPLTRNPDFVGREPLLQQINEALARGRPVALVGPPGVGKTQLALEYTYRFAPDYAIIWWLRAADPLARVVDLAALAPAVDPAAAEAEPLPDRIRRVRARLAARRDWLLVLDAAPDPAAVAALLPEGGGHVLITTRTAGWTGTAATVPVGPMSHEDAAALLLHASGEEDPIALLLQTAEPPERDDAADLADAVERHPLALAQAGAYARQTGRPLADCAELVRARRGSRSPAAPGAVTTDLALEQIGHDGPVVTDVLRLCAFVAPEGLPLALPATYAAALPPRLAALVRDPLAFEHVLLRLQRFALAEREGDALRTHTLVQRAVREALTADERRAWAAAAAEMMYRALTGVAVPDARDRLERLAPHAHAAAAHAERLDAAPGPTATLFALLGRHLLAIGDPLGALPALRRALAVQERADGPHHPGVAARQRDLARALEAAGHHDDAAAVYHRTLAVLETLHGPDHPDVAAALEDLARAARDRGDTDEARALATRAAALYERALGPHDPRTRRARALLDAPDRN